MRTVQNITTGEKVSVIQLQTSEYSNTVTPYQRSKVEELYNNTIQDLSTINGQIKDTELTNKRKLNADIGG